jgi:hypothetical protein
LFRTKEELYKILRDEGDYYLPPLAKTPVDFLKDVLVGKKKLIKSKSVQMIYRTLPRFSELSVKNVWSLVLKRRDLLLYFPNYKPHTLPDRLYLFNVVNTLENNCLESLYKKAQNLRGKRNEEKRQEEVAEVAVDKNHLELFSKLSNKSKRIGKAPNYMKVNSKPRKALKKTFETKLTSLEEIEFKLIK